MDPGQLAVAVLADGRLLALATVAGLAVTEIALTATGFAHRGDTDGGRMTWARVRVRPNGSDAGAAPLRRAQRPG